MENTKETKSVDEDTIEADSIEKMEREEREPKREKESKIDKPMKIKESEYNKLVNDAKEFKDKYMRLYAEFENARKRMERDKSDFIKFANEGLIIEILGILDSLELSMKAARENQKENDAFLKGIEMVLANTYEILKRHGVKPIKALGQPFDPHYHEVLMQEETNEHEEGVVLEEFQKGYQLSDRVIRTVKVKIAQRKSENDQSQEETNE